jgi:hypothetical protein
LGFLEKNLFSFRILHSLKHYLHKSLNILVSNQKTSFGLLFHKHVF